MRRFILAMILIFPHATLFASDKAANPIDRWFDKAIQQAQSTLDQRQVYGEACKKWDAELNKVYGRLMSKLNPTQKEKMKTAQRAWVAWRDSELAAQSALILTPDSGTLAFIVADQGALDIVRARALKLLDYENTVDNGL